MSYRLIDSNALALKYPEVNDMPCIYADLPNGLDGSFIFVESEQKMGKWIEHHEPYTWMGYAYWGCSECGYECGYEKDTKFRTSFCPNCGADMRGEQNG